MGVKFAVAAVAAVAVALAASPSEFVASHQQSDGGFAETGQSSDANLTAWAVLGLTAAGKAADRSPAETRRRKFRSSRANASPTGQSAYFSSPASRK